jgi:hypothetical protein
MKVEAVKCDLWTCTNISLPPPEGEVPIGWRQMEVEGQDRVFCSWRCWEKFTQYQPLRVVRDDDEPTPDP